MILRKPNSNFTLANFFRAQLYSAMATLKLGMDLLAEEQVAIDGLTGHGGLFKTPVVGQRYMAAACNAPISVMKAAGEGGPYGMALLAAFADREDKTQSLEDYLTHRVFCRAAVTVIHPDPADTAGFRTYIEQFRQLLEVERTAIQVI